jgi:tubulin-specific chaperone B
MITNDASSTPSDMEVLKHFITAQDAAQYAHLDPSLVVVDLTHSNLQQRHIEIRFSKHAPLEEVRQRIHQKTGTPAMHQHLQIWHGNQLGLEIPPETEGHYPLGFFGIVWHGLRIHCMDVNPFSGSAGGAYEDTSLVPKFVLSDAEYQARTNTLRHWSEEQKARDPTFSLRKHAQQHRELVEAQRQHKMGLALPPGFFVDSAGLVVREEPDVDDVVHPAKQSTVNTPSSEFGPDSVVHITLHARCQVEPGGRRGRIAYCGEIPELTVGGYWVGVIFDEPVGSNDGTVQGKRYFEAPGDKYGAFVRGSKAQCGDFPELDLFDDYDDEL